MDKFQNNFFNQNNQFNLIKFKNNISYKHQVIHKIQNSKDLPIIASIYRIFKKCIKKIFNKLKCKFNKNWPVISLIINYIRLNKIL